MIPGKQCGEYENGERPMCGIVLFAPLMVLAIVLLGLLLELVCRIFGFDL